MNLFPPEISQLVLDNFGLILMALFGYVLIFGFISFAAKRHLTADVGDYVVASRNLGWIVVTFTMYATVLSGVGMLGIPGTIYLIGTPFVVAVLTGNTLSVALLNYFGPRIWLLGKTYNFTTPGDLLAEYYQSDTIRMYTVVASLFYNIAYIVAQLLAGGILLSVLSGGLIPFRAGIFIITVVVLIHVAFAGLRGIAWLDFFNGVLILLLLVAFGFTIAIAAGGLSAVLEGLGELRNRFVAIPGVVPIFTPMRIYGVALGLSVGALVLSPAAWVRMYSARGKEFFPKISVLLLVLWLFSHVFGTYLIGSYGRALFPAVENPDFVSSLLALTVLPIGLAALFLMAVLAAIISTTDTYLHVMTAAVVRDCLRTIFWPKMTGSHEFRLNQFVSVLVSAVCILLALLNPVLITPLAIFAGGVTLQLMTPLLGAVTWSRASTEAALVAPAVGIVLTIVWEMGIVTHPVPAYILPGLGTAFLINVFLFFLISFFTRPQPPERVEQFHGLLAKEL